MNSTKIAENMKASRDYTTEVIQGALSIRTLIEVSEKLHIPPDALYVSCGGGEALKLSVPGAKPIRDKKMGEKA